MKSRISSYSKIIRRLYSSIKGCLHSISGKKRKKKVIPRTTRCIAVDSRGSTKPDAKPIDKQFLFHISCLTPVANGITRGSVKSFPSTTFSRVSVASSSEQNLLEYTYPLPVLLCNGIRHVQP